ncbi:DUF3862 domain-containing protein [Salibacterium halotolerans]|uniref:Beta-lactamase inhibitor (BLIP) n=1 Tax=Salibacterium halotolerans TaxID=1884432 RepID=A0A1I5MIJ2_9BACI|nr:DUF3862 domain-containing protein [Salibacterium halotolerans]SFP09349.1 Beta-lactamase inhibitor (BLIP) [Salibacterium halotolerans]
MGKAFKGCLTAVVALIVLIIIIAAFTGGGNDSGSGSDSSTETTTGETTSESETSNSADQSSEQNQESSSNNDSGDNSNSGSNEGEITQEKFDSIESGMTYEEVVEIIGSEGEVMSESGEEGSEFHTIMYSWETSDAFGGNANFTFQNGELTNKAQAGLSGGESDVTITMEQFDQLENGMTTQEVFDIVGGEGEVTSESGEEGSQYYTVTYTYYGESGMGANATLMFQGGELSSKSQIGLQ